MLAAADMARGSPDRRSKAIPWKEIHGIHLQDIRLRNGSGVFVKRLVLFCRPLRREEIDEPIGRDQKRQHGMDHCAVLDASDDPENRAHKKEDHKEENDPMPDRQLVHRLPPAKQPACSHRDFVHGDFVHGDLVRDDLVHGDLAENM
jgi:hypothetical protein